MEAESRQLNEELRYVREDMAQQRIQAATRIQQHESELTKLRQQLANKQNSSSPSEAELERR
jgi:ribosomal protein L29